MNESGINPQGTAPAGKPEAELDRRGFLQKCLPLPLAALTLLEVGQPDNSAGAESKPPEAPAYKAADHNYAMGVDPASCIGCGRCAEACKTENNVPREPFYFRTWIERYVIQNDGTTVVTSPEGGINGGLIIAQGTPEAIGRVKESYTGKYLRKLMAKNGTNGHAPMEIATTPASQPAKSSARTARVR